MSQFTSKLDVEQVEDVSKEGRGTWQLLAPLVYESDVAGVTITVPAGFVTDFASVLRIPIVFDWLGDRGNLAATVHDYLYTQLPDGTHPVASRELADAVLKEALLVQGVGLLEAEALYAGVRVCGALYY